MSDVVFMGKDYVVLEAFGREEGWPCDPKCIAAKAWFRKNDLKRKHRSVLAVIRRLLRAGFIERKPRMLYDKTRKSDKGSPGAYVVASYGWEITEMGKKFLESKSHGRS